MYSILMLQKLLKNKSENISELILKNHMLVYSVLKNSMVEEELKDLF